MLFNIITTVPFCPGKHQPGIQHRPGRERIRREDRAAQLLCTERGNLQHLDRRHQHPAQATRKLEIAAKNWLISSAHASPKSNNSYLLNPLT